ncbi:MAG: CarD family transcriptional regulator [Evtepia sp.]
MDELLHELPEPGRITLAVGGLSAGFDYPDGKLAVSLRGRSPPRAKAPPQAGPRGTPPPARNCRRPSPTSPLGDLVVHDHHGIGRFVGIDADAGGRRRRRTISRSATPGADCALCPGDSAGPGQQVHRRRRGPEQARLNKLGGTEWAKHEDPRQERLPRTWPRG